MDNDMNTSDDRRAFARGGSNGPWRHKSPQSTSRTGTHASPHAVKSTRPHSPPDNRFAPTIEAAMQRLERVRPSAYSKTRNFLDGAVTRLSPYLTHGLLDIPSCIEHVSLRHPLTLEDKLVYEFAWREYFHHVWSRLGDKILSDVRSPVWRGRYQTELPEDIRSGATGVAVIDQAVRALYADGYLHNHMRMWLASYTVHIRKVDWKVGAAWMYGHLLDGDLASNWLSWQWVAGTFAHKPYLFNAENVSRYAAGMDCRGTQIDTSYVDLEAVARGRNDLGPEPGKHRGVEEPQCHGDLQLALQRHGFQVIDAQDLAQLARSRTVHLVHPWDLGNPVEPGMTPVAWLNAEFHHRFKWSERRWDFVLERLREITQTVWIDQAAEQDAPHDPLSGTQTHLNALSTMNPGYGRLMQSNSIVCRPAPRFFSNPVQLQPSFTRFFDHAMAGREITSLSKGIDRQTA